MFKKLTDGFQSTLAQAGEQAKARNTNTNGTTASPRPSTSTDRVPAMPSVHVPYEEGSLESDNEEESSENRTEAKQDADVPKQDTPPVANAELSATTQKRLNKLARYEQKYPELLKAYRALQALEGNVKTFEKVLGEITPATSVNDVEAFQQWANNFALKTQMSTDELRRVSGELETLKAGLRTKTAEYESSVADLKGTIKQQEQQNQSTIDTTQEQEYKDKISQLEKNLKAQESLQADLATSHTANEDLTNQLTISATALKDAQDRVKSLEKTNNKLVAEAASYQEESRVQLEELRKEIVDLKVKHTQALRKEHKSSEISQQPGKTAEEPVDAIESASTTPLSKGQKKRQKKKNNTNTTAANPTESAGQISESAISSTASLQQQIQDLTKERDDLQLALDTLQATAENYASEKLNYETKLQKLLQHQESVEELRDMVKDVGNDLVEAKDQIKALTSEKNNLRSEITTYRTANETLSSKVHELEAESANGTNKASSEEFAAITQERNELQDKLSNTEFRLSEVSRDLMIAEKLSAERFQDLSAVKNDLRLAMSDAADLRKQNQKLTTDKTGLENSFRTAEAKNKASERAEKDRREELSTCQRNLASREKELKVIQSAFKEEETRRKSEESRASTLKAEVGNLTNLRDSIISSRNDLNTQLSNMKSELDDANTKLTSLQQLRNKLMLERDAAQEELLMSKAKFDSSHSLMESQREQTVDMQNRLRETSDKYEAMEEELSESQRNLNERAREAETLRRLLSDIEANQESRLREMRTRMESAITERDKAEDEAAFTGKKRAREVEELKEKLLDVERLQRKMTIEKQDLNTSLEELRIAMQNTRSLADSRERDAKDLRETMNGLSQSLREAEAQISALEQERDTLRSVIKESAGRIERMSADAIAKDDMLSKLRTERAHMLDRQDSFQHDVQSPTSAHRQFARSRQDSMTSIPSTPTGLRSPSLFSVSLSEPRVKEKAEVDREYIKNVLFQFLEHKDKRKYLMPAISKLLLLSKQQEGIFSNALK
ncbi:MAG: hypothetical protein EOO61_00420 [Hymenobacter sp.]|nr:MAG: hypothetical protein EOO61_00420 [Hymenobacter sp.]